MSSKYLHGKPCSRNGIRSSRDSGMIIGGKASGPLPRVVLPIAGGVKNALGLCKSAVSHGRHNGPVRRMEHGKHTSPKNGTPPNGRADLLVHVVNILSP